MHQIIVSEISEMGTKMEILEFAPSGEKIALERFRNIREE